MVFSSSYNSFKTTGFTTKSVIYSMFKNTSVCEKKRLNKLSHLLFIELDKSMPMYDLEFYYHSI